MSRAAAGLVAMVLGAVVLGGLVAGCATRTPAPVGGWDEGAPVPEGHYRVKPGDTLSEVAERLKLDFPSLARWNRLTPPYKIVAGRLLRIVPPPAGGKGGTVSAEMPHAAGGGQSAEVGREAPPPAAAANDSQRGKGPPARDAREGAEAAPKVPLPTASASKAGSEKGNRTGGSRLTWQWPLRGAVKQTFAKGDRTRSGIRIRGKAGDPVVAAEAGSVVYSGSGLKGYGNLIIVKHNKNYLSAYGFNRRLLVREGERVERGQAVAEVGQASGGDWMLHFEIRKNGTAVDPLSYLPRSR